MRISIAGSILLLLAACASSAPSPVDAPLGQPPLGIELTAAEAASWRHRHFIEADLDGDGTAESVILTADVTISDRGAPLWEDGHRWALLVREGSDLTLLYSAFVPNGFVEAAVLEPSMDGARDVLVQERSPGQLRALTLRYGGPGRGMGVSIVRYSIGHWLPGSARLTD